MITINVIDEKICGSYGDTPFTVDYSKELYNEMQKLAAEGASVETVDDYKTIISEFADLCVVDYTKAIETKCEYIHVNKATGEFFLKHEGATSSIPMPEALVDRIFDSLDKDLDFMPLVKMWTRWLRNPVLWQKMRAGYGNEFSERFFNFVNMQYVHPKLKADLIEQGLTEDAAEKRAIMYQMKITNEGLLNGYKVSREVLHKYDQETGEEVDRRLESWDQVNVDDRRSCVKGLHIGGLMYINCYSGEIHNIFVDPMHIGAVPDDDTGAIRCKQYFVHSSLVGVNGSIYHSSSYAAMTDAEWDDMRIEAVEARAIVKAQCDREVAEINSL
mgnify:CR=1 FL=1